MCLGHGRGRGRPGAEPFGGEGWARRARGAVSGRCHRAASLAAPFLQAKVFRVHGRRRRRRQRWPRRRRFTASWGGRSVRLSEARHEDYTRVPPEPAPTPAPAGPQPGGSSSSPRRRAAAAAAGRGGSGSAAKRPQVARGPWGRRAGALGK